MKVEEDLHIYAAPDSVWKAVSDVDVLAGSLPGVTLAPGTKGDGSYLGTITVTFGPTKVTWKGTAQIESDDETRALLIRAKGQDDRGQSQARAKIGLRVRASDESSVVEVDADVDVSGMLGAFAATGGPPILRGLLDTFGRNLGGYLAPAPVGGDVAAAREKSEATLGLWTIVRMSFLSLFRRRGRRGR